MIRKVIYISLITIALALPFIHFYNGITDQFLFRNVGYAEKFLDRDSIPVNDHRLYDGVFFYAPASEIITIMFSKIIAIHPKYLQFVPIMIIPFIFSLYLFVKKINISKSIILNLLTVSIIIFSVGIKGTNLFTIWPHSWAFTLFVLNMSILYDILNKKSNRKLILFLIIFVAIHLYSYTVEMWMVSFSVLYLVLLIISKIGLNSKIFSRIYNMKNNINIDMYNLKMNYQIKKSYYLSLIMLIIMLAYNRMIYYSYLPKRKVELEINSFSIFLEKYFHVQAQQYPTYTYKVPFEYSMINILIIITILIPILIGILKLIYNPKKYITYNNIFWYYFIISLLGVAIIDMIIYSLAGVITFRYLIFIYPAISISFIYNFSKNKKIRTIFLTSILSLVIIIGPISAYYYGMFNISESKYTEFEPGCHWFLNKSESRTLLGDQSSVDKCFLESMIKGININRSYFVDSTYTYIINYKEVNQSLIEQKMNGYIFLNMKFGRIDNANWRQYQPFSKYTYSINNNIQVDKIYADGSLWIMKLR